jgi:hypothetical protein
MFQILGLTMFMNRVVIYRVQRGISSSSPYFAPLSNQITGVFRMAEFYFLCSDNNLTGTRSDSDFLRSNNCLRVTRRVLFNN